MAHTQNRATTLSHVRHFAQALFLKLRIADCQHLVHYQNFRIEMRRYGKGEPNIHARRVALHRRLDKFLYASEIDDLIELARDLGASHAKDRTIEIDVLAAGQLGVESGADLEQRRSSPAEADLPARRLGDAAQK